MKICIQMKVFNDDNYPVYETRHDFDDPLPTSEFQGIKIYDFGFKYAEPAQPIWLRKSKIESEKIPEEDFREKVGEFSTKINQDLGILGE